jgi:segregation and condensation protein B
MTELEHEQLERAVEQRELPYFFTLERSEQLHALEALIFASEEPLTNRMLHRLLVLEDPSQQAPGQQQLPLEGEQAQPVPETVVPTFDVPKEFFDELVEEINDQLERVERPYRIVKIAGGFQFATTPAHGLLVQRLLKAKNRRRLTQAALETVAIIAYRQPITKAEIDAIRGVNSGEVVNSLVEKQLVAMVGRAETLGKPLLYGTTEEFLRVFGLNDISDLPKLREIDDLIKTTTTMIDLDDSISIKTDHRTLRKQLALLLDGDSAQPETDAGSTVEATSGAYWHHSMENEAEQGLVEDPEPGTWEHDETPKDVDNLANPNETRD